MSQQPEQIDQAEQYLKENAGYTPHYRFDDCEYSWDSVIGWMEEYASQQTASLQKQVEHLQVENKRLLHDEFEWSNLQEQVRKLQAFKDYVHNRLDEMGIEKDPESEHKAAGCRIGGRLDIVQKQVEELRKAQVNVMEAFAEYASHRKDKGTAIAKINAWNHLVFRIDSLKALNPQDNQK